MYESSMFHLFMASPKMRLLKLITENKKQAIKESAYPFCTDMKEQR